MKLAFKAYDKSGKVVADTIESADAGAAAEDLSRKGLYVIEIAEAAGSSTDDSGKSGTRLFGRAHRLKELAIFTRLLYVLASSGTQLVEALGALERQAKAGPWRDVISAIRLRVEEGLPLSEAMSAHPEYFDPIYCGLVAAGESSGQLPVMLNRLAGLKQKQLRIRNSIVGALIYPSLLLIIAVSVMSLLLFFVVPRFAGLFVTLGVPLPGSTKALVAISTIFRSYWWGILSVLIGCIVVAVAWLKTPAGKLYRDSTILRLPQIGKIVKNFATARIVRLLGVLMESHVTVLEALQLTRQAAGNIRYNELISRAEEQVSQGELISSAFSDTDLITPSVCEAIRSGEQSGRLGPLLVNIADFLDDENEVIVRSLTSIIEPLILVLLGLLVGAVAISMFMPLFDLTSMMEGGAA